MKKETRKRVMLEPVLEAIAGELDAAGRMRLAVIYAERAARLGRWARELRVSSLALRPAPPRRRRLPQLSSVATARN